MDAALGPTIGSVEGYEVPRAPDEPLALGEMVHFIQRGTPLAAIVCKIFPAHDTVYLGGPAGITKKQPHAVLVNLSVFSEDGQMLNKIRVPFIGREDVEPSVNYCKRA